MMITAKAKFVCNVKRKDGHDYNVELTAGSGRFNKFKNHYLLHSVNLSGQSLDAHLKAAKEFLETLDESWIKNSC